MKFRKQQNPRVRETAMNNTMAAHSGACDGGRNSNGDSRYFCNVMWLIMLKAVGRVWVFVNIETEPI